MNGPHLRWSDYDNNGDILPDGYKRLKDGTVIDAEDFKKGSNMKDKIKQAVKEEFMYRASQGRAQYSVEEVIYIVNEVIDEVTFENNRDISQKQLQDLDMRIRIIKGDLKYLAERVNELSSLLEEQKIKEDTEISQSEWIRLDLAKRVIARFKGYLDEDVIERIQIALEKENEVGKFFRQQGLLKDCEEEES